MPQISGKYQFNVDLKGIQLPVILAIPDIHVTPPFDCPNHLSLVLNKDTCFMETSASASTIITQQPELVIAHASDTPPNSSGATSNSTIEDADSQSLLSDLGINVHSMTAGQQHIKFWWFYLWGTTMLLINPPCIQSINRFMVNFQLFDVFIHTYHPASSQFSAKHTLQLLVWETFGTSTSSEVYFWKSVIVGYMCPGPGEL
ncbi:hypothetical protein F5148DRAFT_1293205 [Russula earlei]|uniref:Uncharacterized protein n=1 Tax=Russula earlei TaxID=71964 RepID=A0ACC0TT93_9AGAM|nr:hypothetical protein F5148DRAFT_1293205 [Russula earlei]